MSEMVKKERVIGVDVGGTKVAAGLVDRDGVIGLNIRVAMSAKGTAEEGLAAVQQGIDLLLRESGKSAKDLKGIGICAPGPLDPKTGIVVNPPNLTCWRNFPLGAEISQRYGVPVKVDNDANAAALAEALWGAGRGYKTVFYACIGTGIGTGIVFDGRIYHGRTGAAAEGGHVSIDYRGPVCGCGKRGCIEILAAGPAIARRARAKLSEQPSRTSAMRELSHGNIDAVSSEMVGQANAAGDALAREVLRETVELLALWLGNVVDFLEPDVMIIGGGVAAMLRPFFAEFPERLAAHCVNSRSREVPLLVTHYGADSGIAGGAALCSAIS